MRDRQTWWLLRLAMLVVLTHAASARAQSAPRAGDAPAREWSLVVSPYAWFAGARTLTTRGSLDTSAADFVKMVDASVMLRAEATWRRLGVSADYMYIKLSDGESIRSNELTLDLKEHRLELLASYRLYPRLDPPHAADGFSLYADSGAIYSKLDTRFRFYDASDATKNQDFANGDGWWDWTIGAHARIPVTRVIAFSLASNIGGFGIANCTRYTFKFDALINFRLWRMLWLGAGYRAIISDQPDVADGKIERVTLSGALVGLGVVLP